MPQKASINTDFSTRFCLRKVRKTKVFFSRNWCERVLSIVCYYKTYKKYRWSVFVFVVVVVVLFCFFFCMGACPHVTLACMRYRRRESDISPDLIVMFSNIHIHWLCHACCWRNAVRMKFFQHTHRKSSSTLKIRDCKRVRDVSCSTIYQWLVYLR